MKNLKKLSRSELINLGGGANVDTFLDAGGGGSCRITVTYPGGGFGSFDTPTSGTCKQQSQQANDQCLIVMGNTAGARCRYDCACDGYGQ